MRQLLRPAFQPVMRISADGRHQVAYFEALMRLNGDQTSSLHVNLIKAGESMGFIGALDVDMLKQIVTILDDISHIRIACNLSVPTLEHFIDEVCNVIGVAPEACANRLVIEVTETCQPSSYDKLAFCASELRERGIIVAVDDFGDGYADEAMVEALRPAFVKLTANALTGPSIIARAVKQAARFKSGVVAEHISSHIEVERMLSAGVAFGQGFLFGSPEPTIQHPDMAGQGILPLHLMPSFYGAPA